MIKIKSQEWNNILMIWMISKKNKIINIIINLKKNLYHMEYVKYYQCSKHKIVKCTQDVAKYKII